MTRSSIDDPTSGPEAPAPSAISRRAFVGVGGAALAVAASAGGSAGYLWHRLNEVGTFDPARLARLRGDSTCALFRRHPALARSVPWRPIGTFPTPVRHLDLPEGAARGTLLAKDEGTVSDLYGGNKVRKLQHLLAEAELADRSTLITVGGLGTNHWLATALHGAALGFGVELALFDQPRTPWVERNRAGFRWAGARVHVHRGEIEALLGARRLVERARERGAAPRFINLGGSSRLGTVGFVDAAFELAEQVRAGELPAPDRIYVALGTCGTAAGLVAGLRAAGLPSRVCAVRVSGLFPGNRFVVRHMADDVAGWLRDRDPDFPAVRIGLDDFEVVGDFLGPGYGVPTPEGEAAMRWAAPPLSLDPTYTGKALAACLEYCRGEMRDGETVLFWNTYSAAPEPWAS